MVKKPTLLIFGGSSGIASPLVKVLKKKYEVILFYNKKIPAEKNVKKIKLDFSKNLDFNKAIKSLNLSNKKLIVLNFASLKIDKISLFIDHNDLIRTFNVNTFSFFKVIKNLLPIMMKKKWGRIINISSTGGRRGDKGTLLYTSSKNATESMMRVMSKEYASMNITFNSLILGNFNFGMYKKLNKSLKKEILKKIPSGKTGNISNIINAVNFVVESEYINGSAINVDGGY